MKPRDAEDKLINKFDFEKDEGESHRYLILDKPGHRLIRTHFSHGKKELSKGLRATIARQLGVNKSFFEAMVACTKSKEDYYNKIKNNESYNE